MNRRTRARWEFRIWLALFFIELVNWPLSHLTYARSEPPTVLALSHIAILLTAATGMNAAKADEPGD